MKHAVFGAVDGEDGKPAAGQTLGGISGQQDESFKVLRKPGGESGEENALFRLLKASSSARGLPVEEGGDDGLSFSVQQGSEAAAVPFGVKEVVDTGLFIHPDLHHRHHALGINAFETIFFGHFVCLYKIISIRV